MAAVSAAGLVVREFSRLRRQLRLPIGVHRNCRRIYATFISSSTGLSLALMPATNHLTASSSAPVVVSVH